MPFVNFPIQCCTCRGLGKIKPLSAFEMHQKALAIDCPNCLGKGLIENKVYVNPEVPSAHLPVSSFVLNDESAIEIESISPQLEEEVQQSLNLLKKVKSKKSDFKDAC